MLRPQRPAAPTVVGLVQGAAFGGGVGLVACCDIALAAEEAVFCLSEVRLGLIPAVISPYVVRAMGARAARRYFLTAERFEAATARHLGLVHEVVARDGLEAAGEGMIGHLLGGGPQAQQVACPRRWSGGEVQARPVDQETFEYTPRTIADIRASAEGREGVAAFLEKRKPNWVGG